MCELPLRRGWLFYCPQQWKNEPLATFPSWFLRIECDQCDNTVHNEADMHRAAAAAAADQGHWSGGSYHQAAPLQTLAEVIVSSALLNDCQRDALACSAPQDADQVIPPTHRARFPRSNLRRPWRLGCFHQEHSTHRGNR